ncbi:phage integrase family protein [Paraburkholderia fungorum]|uniref:Phage integrase family protein n=1 Tax=Paraburkholderia fungorum TaxID=134537 RepID=A0AAU8TAY1_9BURK|nr:integrase family protein [Paraburkholderia fungorum]AJZ61074.1 phage integrase family protein [Paraburkholderia fungorum]
MRFDAREAKQLQPGQHMTIDGCPGLRLEVSKTRRTWTYRYKRLSDAKIRQVKIGEWPAISVQAASSAWEKLREARDKGEDPAGEKREARREAEAERNATLTRQTYTVRQLVDDYIQGHVQTNYTAHGVRTSSAVVKDLGALEGRDAGSITRTEAFALIQSRLDTPVAANKLRGELARAWDYAIDAGKLPEDTHNWWRQVMKGRIRSKGKVIAGERFGTHQRVLSPKETGELIRWLPNFSELFTDVLTVYLWTGLRGGEILQMEGSEVSEEGDGLWWTCPKRKTKNRNRPQATDHRVPLIGRVEQIVRKRLERYGKGLLFRHKTGSADTGKGITQNAVSSMVYHMQPYSAQHLKHQRLPVTHWSPHDLRRTARTMLSSIGCPFEIGEIIIGHVIPGVGGVYDKYTYDKERREWLTKLADKLEELASTR